MRSLVAVVTDRFDRASFERLHAQRNLVFRGRLLVDKGIPPFIVPGEKGRGCLPTEITINALLIDEEFTRDVGFPFVCFVGHVAPQQTGIEFAVKRRASREMRADKTLIASWKPPYALGLKEASQSFLSYKKHETLPA